MEGKKSDIEDRDGREEKRDGFKQQMEWKKNDIEESDRME